MAARDMVGRLRKLDAMPCATEEDMLFEDDLASVSPAMAGCTLMGTEDDMMAAAEDHLVPGDKELVFDGGVPTSDPAHKRAGGQGPRRRRRAVFAAAGSTALMTVVAVGAAVLWLRAQSVRSREQPSQPPPVGATSGPICAYAERFACPARMLLGSAELHEVATENVIKVSRGLLGSFDRPLVLSAVARGFGLVDEQLAKDAPMAAGELEMLHLTESQKDLVMHCMQLLSDPRVQRIGLNVAQAIRDSPSKDREDLRHHIEESLHPRAEEIRRLRDELVPAELRDPDADGEGYEWELTLDPANVHTMAAVSDEWRREIDSPEERRLSPASTAIGEVSGSVYVIPPADQLQKARSISAGVAEEARALLDILDLCMRIFGRGSILSLGSQPLVRALDSGSESSVSCHLDSGEGAKVNLTKAVLCPLKFGSLGIDAMRAELDVAAASSKVR